MTDLAPAPHLIEKSFFSKTGAKSQSLINQTENETYVEGKNIWYGFKFAEPVFLTKIEVFCEGYKSWNSMRLIVEHVDGSETEESVKIDDTVGAISFDLGKLSTSFKFKPDRRSFADTRLTRVSAHGYTLEEFNAFEGAVEAFEIRNKKLQTRESDFSKLSETVDVLNAQKKQLDTEIGQSKARSEALQSEISKADTAFAERRANLKDVESRIDARRGDLRNLDKTITEKARELNELTKEVRLFPSEITGFVREGNRSITSYLMIGAPFLAILLFVANSLFSSAVDLTQLWNKGEDVDIWVVFLTRLPFVLVAIAIIEGCGYVVGRLVYEIMRINRQRLEFSKLSIIAKDVTVASSKDLEMTTEQLYEREVELKMELLREHMKNYSGSEFEYRGSALISALVGVAERIGKRSSSEI